MQIQLQMIQNDKKTGTMYINGIAPITHTSNCMSLKCSFSNKSDQQERQGDKNTDIQVDKVHVI
jgi:hypothetical protein